MKHTYPPPSSSTGGGTPSPISQHVQTEAAEATEVSIASLSRTHALCRLELALEILRGVGGRQGTRDSGSDSQAACVGHPVSGTSFPRASGLSPRALWGPAESQTGPPPSWQS